MILNKFLSIYSHELNGKKILKVFFFLAKVFQPKGLKFQLNCSIYFYFLSFSYILFLKQVTFFGSSMYHRKELPIHSEIQIDGLEKPAFIHNGGMIITGADGQRV